MTRRATNRPVVLCALLMTMFLAAMEGTAVSTVMPTVIGDLGGVARYSWVFTAYMLASTVTVPIYGKLADLFGRKKVLLIGLLLFLIGSSLSGAAATLDQLIAYRALQGLGAGAVQTISLTVVGDLYTLEERARIQGVFAAMWGIAGVSGPLLGGLIVESLSWRWVFYINVPIAIAALAVLLLAFHETVAAGRAQAERPRLDLAGAATLVLGSVALLAAVNGLHPAASGAAGAALLVAFVGIERRAPDALLPPAIFKRRLMVVASISTALVGAVMFPVVTYLPLYAQGVAGGTPTEAGSALIPMMVGWPLAATVTGRFVTRLGFRPFLTLGTVVAALATLAMALLVARGAALGPLAAATAVFGIGLGLVNTPLVLSVQTSVAWQERGVATASTMFFRTIVGTLAVGLLGLFLREALAGSSGLPPDQINALLGAAATGHGADAPPAALAALADALRGGLTPIFWAVFACAAANALVAQAFPRAPAGQ